MSTNKTSFISTLLLLISSSLIYASTVMHSPQDIITLQERWTWAEKKAENLQSDYWVGYSIKRLMSRNSFIGSWSGSDYGKPTLRMILYGVEVDYDQFDDNSETSIKEAAENALRDKEGYDEKVMKNVALLFYFQKGQPKLQDLIEMKVSNLSQHVDLKDKPVIWLGDCNKNESVAFLETGYKRPLPQKIKKEIIMAVAIHHGLPSVIAFLSDIVREEDSSKLRKTAVFWLSQQGTDRVLPILVKTAIRDPSKDVREQAVFAVSQVRSDEATETLINLVRNAQDHNVQKKAIFWLGQKASKRAAETLEEVAYDDNTIEIQEQAVFALSQLKRGEGVPGLIKIAKSHPSIEVRKKAIFWLSQTDDPRALDTIIKLARK
jgi:hypothetical protein